MIFSANTTTSRFLGCITALLGVANFGDPKICPERDQGLLLLQLLGRTVYIFEAGQVTFFYCIGYSKLAFFFTLTTRQRFWIENRLSITSHPSPEFTLFALSVFFFFFFFIFLYDWNFTACGGLISQDEGMEKHYLMLFSKSIVLGHYIVIKSWMTGNGKTLFVFIANMMSRAP